MAQSDLPPEGAAAHPRNDDFTAITGWAPASLRVASMPELGCVQLVVLADGAEVAAHRSISPSCRATALSEAEAELTYHVLRLQVETARRPAQAGWRSISSIRLPNGSWT